MSVETTECTVREYLDALVNGDYFAHYFSDDVLWTTMETGEQVRGREAVRDFIVALHYELFDASPELKHVAVADGVAALEAVFVAKHVGEFAGIPPTGLEVRIPYTVFYTVDREQITEIRAYLPVTALVRQLESARTLERV